MQVILKSYVDNLGDAGDIVTVANGYANNFLIPQNLAMRATKGAVADAEQLRRARIKREAVEISEAEEVAQGIAGRVLTIPATAGEDGTLYGSVGKRDIAEAVAGGTGVQVDAKKVDLDRPIKSVGRHEVSVKLHREVSVVVIIDVVADEIIASGSEELEDALATDEVPQRHAEETTDDTADSDASDDNGNDDLTEDDDV
ncbi:MAG TPA: 50S ribosomal protein L9 [Euzebya sp.]|nr:50S ribosomal protein L9 [Euzebya sp.]